MSCNNTSDQCCDAQAPTTSASGKKISQLNILDPIVARDDFFVVVDVTANETKKVTYETVMTFQNSGTTLSADIIPEAIIELDQELTVHIDEYDIHYPMSSISGLSPIGGDTGQALVKDSNTDYDYSWHDVSSTGSGIPDTPDSDTYLRTNGSWVQSDSFDENTYYTSGDVDIILDDYAKVSTLDDKEDYLGTGIAGQVLATSGIDSRYWVDMSGGGTSGILEAPDNDTYLRSNGVWVQSDQFTSVSYYTVTETNTLLNDKEYYLGTQTSDGQVLASSGTDVRYWVDMCTGGVDDVTSEGTYVRSTGVWIQSEQFDSSNYYDKIDTNVLLYDKVDTSALDGYTTTEDFESHTNDLDIHYPMRSIDAYTESETDALLALKANTSDVLLKDGSVELDSGYETSATGSKGIVTKDFLEQSISTAKTIRTVDFVYAGGVNNSVILEIHSSFNDKSGFPIPSSEYEVYITGIRIASSTSYNNGIDTGVVLRLATLPVNHDKPFGFVTSPTTDNGTTVYENSNTLDGVIQSETKYNFLHNIVDITSPILLTPELVLFCEFHPNFWTFTDVQISIIYDINKVV